jgi:predicted GH43/DUF377 family glycosyl hydrolase
MIALTQNSNWKKLGLIIKPNPNLYWARTHCMIPTPLMLEDGIVRIYFSGRDDKNRSNIGYASIDLNKPTEVLEYSQDPALTPGELGCFDDNGVTPSCIKKIDGKLYLYYIGWNPGSTVRMHLFGGLAISENNGKSFSRWSKAPIIERCKSDPYLNTAPWVVKYENEYRMYYVSGTSWIHRDLPRYNIKFATSEDGLHWIRDGHVCIDFANENENALARPYVLFQDGIWKMWFAAKGTSYRLGYAESLDGKFWSRIDKKVGITTSNGQFDSDMIEYAAIVEYKNKSYMFYNGNNYGYDGIGMAILE